MKRGSQRPSNYVVPFLFALFLSLAIVASVVIAISLGDR